MLKSYIFCFVFLFIIQINGKSQSPFWSWAFSDGGIDNDLGNAICLDNVGDICVVGRFNAAATFGNINLQSFGGPDIFAAKYDQQGQCIWANSYGSFDTMDTYGDEALGVGADIFGNFYITGNFHDSARFGNIQMTGNGRRQIYIAKINTNGNLIWVKEPSGNLYNNYSNSISVDELGNSYITGNLGGSTMFDNFTLSGGGGFVTKYDSAGNVIYATLIGSALNTKGISTDDFGNAYVTGFFQGSQTINNISYSASGNRDVFLIKLNSQGNIVWFFHTSTNNVSSDSYGNAIKVDDLNEIVITGSFIDTIRFGSIILSGQQISNEMFVSKFDSAGNVIWAAATISPVLSSGNTSGNAITTDNQSDIFVTGYRNSDVLFGTCSLPNYYSQTFITKYSSAGSCIFSETSSYGNPGARGNGICINNEPCEVYITGYSKDIVAFGNDTTDLIGMEDMWVAKLDCGLSNNIFDNENEENKVEIIRSRDGKISILNSELSGIEVGIYNIMGDCIFTSKSNSMLQEINFQFQALQIYFIRIDIEDGNIVKTYKLIY